VRLLAYLGSALLGVRTALANERVRGREQQVSSPRLVDAVTGSPTEGRGSGRRAPPVAASGPHSGRGWGWLSYPGVTEGDDLDWEERFG
jgi:hypothetical protein